MANTCNNIILFEGPNGPLNELLSMFQKNYKNLETENLFSLSRGKLSKIFEPNFTIVDVKDTNRVVVEIESRWTQPTDFLVDVSKFYPELKITNAYFEMGCDIGSVSIFENGSYLEEHFGYWELMIHLDRAQALEDVINNELSCYETLGELINSKMFQCFDKEEQSIIINEYTKY